MTLEKQTDPINQIEVVGEHKHVQIREANQIIEDGKVISQTFHRYVIAPGDDYSTRHADIQATCQLWHTPERIAAYQAAQTEQT